jgi:hypothetical protein
VGLSLPVSFPARALKRGEPLQTGAEVGSAGKEKKYVVLETRICAGIGGSGGLEEGLEMIFEAVALAAQEVPCALPRRLTGLEVSPVGRGCASRVSPGLGFSRV